MIAHLKGVLQYKSPETVIIETCGIGYEINIPLSTFYNLLYGFGTHKERELFGLLIKVSKIGPRMARNILSGVSVDEMFRAIEEADIECLSAIPGIGKKTAQRIVLELRNILPRDWSKETVVNIVRHADVKNEAISALNNLGFKTAISEKAVRSVIKRMNGQIGLETLIKESLVLMYEGEL